MLIATSGRGGGENEVFFLDFKTVIQEAMGNVTCEIYRLI